MQNIYFTSDMHFGHKGILEYESRPFKDITEMDLRIVNNWNDTVRKQDKVFILDQLIVVNIF